MDIPIWGKTALPVASSSVTKSDTNKTRKPAYTILKQYARSHPEDPYIGISGTYHPNKKRFKYHVFPLDFDEEIIRKSNGKVIYYSYRMRVKEKGVYRRMGALIPASKKAIRLMSEWLGEGQKKRIIKKGEEAKIAPMLASACGPNGHYVVIFVGANTGEIFGVFERECLIIDGGGGGYSSGGGTSGGGGGPRWPHGSMGCSHCGNPPHAGGGSGNNNKAIRNLKHSLNQNPYLLLKVPCKEISEWKNLAQYEMKDSVTKRLNKVLKDYRIQKLENAAGPIINMDYFSVTVSAKNIPHNWTATEYLANIRRRINQYTDGSVFKPYPGLKGEWKRWLSNDPLGSILSIQLMGSAEWFDDGTVVTSGYESSTNSWIFTTLYTSEDDWHPVSGNRKFGFTKNNDGTVTFFTRGVDRLSNDWYKWGQKITGVPFGETDNLWSSFQDLIAADFNSATIHEPVTWRPNWAKVSAILQGNQSVSTLGCK